MRGSIFLTAALIGAATALSGCGWADNRSPVPAFMRGEAREPPPLDPQPDVKKIVRDKLDTVFMEASKPRHVRVSQPRREPSGPGWTACIKAETTSAMGQPLGTQTYVATISSGTMIDRRRSGEDDNCGSETYDPL